LYEENIEQTILVIAIVAVYRHLCKIIFYSVLAFAKSTLGKKWVNISTNYSLVVSYECSCSHDNISNNEDSEYPYHKSDDDAPTLNFIPGFALLRRDGYAINYSRLVPLLMDGSEGFG